MAGRIPDHFIDELLNRVDIVDVVSSRVPLKKAGKEYQACCPFHDEKTPSFTVSREKQFYHCFGCGVHGTAIGFLMEHDNMEFVESIEELAQQQGLEVPREGGGRSGPDPSPLYDTLEQVDRFYQQQLSQYPQAIQYLKQRGLSGEIAATFGIGYAPPGWDNLIRQQGTTAETLDHLRLTGMISEPDNKCFDRFRDRIMFPIRDRRGRVIAFGGRILGDGKPKYLNSPGTALFHKGRELYGLHEAKQALRKLERLLVVEGYMDVVALAQFGICYTVATLGTATTLEHLEQLFRTTSEVVFCFDGDRAGREAGWKALNTALPLMRDGREARFLFLPEGEDPDSMIRKEGADAFEQRIASATPLSSFLFDHLQGEGEMTTPSELARLAELATPLLERLPKGVFREIMWQNLSQLVGINIPQPEERSRPKSRPQQAGETRGTSITMTPIRLAIALLLRHPPLALLPNLPKNWQLLQIPGIQLLSDLLAIIENQPTLKPAQIIERWQGSEEYQQLNRLAAMNPPIPEEGLEMEFRDTLKSLDNQSIKQETTQLLEKAKKTNLSNEEKSRLKQLLSRTTPLQG